MKLELRRHLRQLLAAGRDTVRWHLVGRRGPCSDLEPFADGTLDYVRADAFTRHLPECPHCQSGLTGLMQLEELGARYSERSAER